ncbi:MAG: NAD(P)/FAD-dependent oxidoreductase [Actinobacteria bacterium]|nr:NAD(P)/FAD-dependent oxidoreductase [Actinomycetota bacterium]
MNSQFDAIVIGSGHNGLIAANYLSDAGKRVAVVERRGLVGGATVTEEVIPGFRASACSYVSGLLHPQILSDLGLDAYGLHLYQTEVGSASILRDGRHLFLYNDLSRTLREIRDVAATDADALVAFGLRLERFASITGQWLLTDSPPSVDEVMRTFYESGEGDLFNEFFTLSVLDLLERYFSTDIVKGLFTFLAVVSVWGGPRTPGWSYVYGHHATGEFNGHMGQFAFPRGGMGSIAESLAARARARGAVVRTNAPVASINVERGRVAGVVLENGEEIRASIVLSNADPRRTFLSLIDANYLPDEYRQQITRYDARGSMARVFLALDSLPDFIGCAPGMGPQHRGLTLLGAEVENFQRMGDAQQHGRIPDDFPIEFIIQTTSDDSLAPAGKHLLSTGIQQLPFTLANGTWDDYRDEFTTKVINVLSDYSPGIKDRIIGTHTITPLDLEREYALPGGNIFHGAMTLGQLYASRPVPGYASYRSPIAGLYLCGAGTHPGGGVMGAPGYNAARAVLADEAAGGWRPQRRSGVSMVTRTPMRHRLMSKPGVRKVALALARQPLLGSLVDKASKR